MNIEPIGFVTSCYKEKFGIPRQPGLVPLAKATLTLTDNYSHPDMVRGLASFSHIWLIFGFHATAKQGWKALVRPPRLGGNERVGVFASRSMFRPNGMGLSVCKLDSVVMEPVNKDLNNTSMTVTLHLSGIDILNNTPVFDIKPYICYSDAIPDASSSYASDRPRIKHPVIFSETAKHQCIQEEKRSGIDILELISQILAQDPRPAFHQNSEEKHISRTYGMKLYNLDIRWKVEKQVVNVLSLW